MNAPNHQIKRVDALVIGGGIAGSTAAAALAREGLQVLICEAGLPSEKRLAGELMHPPAADVLDELGLLAPLEAAGAAPVYGFAVYPGPTDKPAVLSYAEVPGGRPSSIAFEHAKLTRILLGEVAKRDRIEVWDGARVVDVDFMGSTPRATVKIKPRGERESIIPGDDGSSENGLATGTTALVEAKLVVSAEGRASKARAKAGIEGHKGDAFRMVGWRIPDARLPVPGFGHVFSGPMGGPTALAYQITRATEGSVNADVRVMFELHDGEDLDIRPHLARVPVEFRRQIERAMETMPRQTAKVWSYSPEAVTHHGLAVVGDAGGCVHPLTATGIAFSTRDGLRLAKHVAPAVLDPSKDMGKALAQYEGERKHPMLTRAALGPALAEALNEGSPAFRLLRRGLFRYWQKSPRGRRASIGLLSTQETNPLVMVREYAAVCMHALAELPKEPVAPWELIPAVSGLAQQTAMRVKEVGGLSR